MSPEQKLRELESKITYLEAIIDGSEAQTRDATVYLVGIVTRFLHEKGVIDERALKDYVRTFEGDASDREDYLGDLVRQFGFTLSFHERYPAEFELAGSVSTSEPPIAGPRGSGPGTFPRGTTWPASPAVIRHRSDPDIVTLT